jgi:anti-sigma B factor antagonist
VELSVVTRREGVRTVISVTGEIDVYTAPTLRERLNELVADGEYHLVVDMAGVDFLDSTGLGVLVGGLKRARSHDGTLQLVCDQEKILKVFRITGLTKVFPIHASLGAALATDPAGPVNPADSTDSGRRTGGQEQPAAGGPSDSESRGGLA